MLGSVTGDQAEYFTECGESIGDDRDGVSLVCSVGDTYTWPGQETSSPFTECMYPLFRIIEWNGGNIAPGVVLSGQHSAPAIIKILA